VLTRICAAVLSCSVLGCAANRAATEAAERHYAKEQYVRATEARIQQTYSTEPLERRVAGKVFRIPANYITYFGKEGPKQNNPNEVGVYMFLPGYAGSTPDNWRQFGKPHQSGLFVHIRAQQARVAPEDLIRAFIASNPPRTTAFGLPAYHFDIRKTSLRLPKTGHWVEYVFTGIRNDGETVYMICQAPDTFLKLPDDPKCEVFASDSASGLRIHLMFSQIYAPNWLEIERKVSEMIGQWLRIP
jgi:hypothetical protein